MSFELDDIAYEAVDRLGIAAKIDAERATLLERIRECDALAAAAGGPWETFFFTTALPIVNGFIQYATSKPKLGNAINWVRENWKGNRDLDWMAVLTLLTLVYIVRTALRDARGTRDEATWKRLYAIFEELVEQRT